MQERGTSAQEIVTALLITAAVAAFIVAFVCRLMSYQDQATAAQKYCKEHLNQMRIFREGDTWTYTVRGRMYLAAVPDMAVGIVKGAMTDKIIKVTPYGKYRYYTEDIKMSVENSAGAAKSIETNATFIQDPATGTTYLVSDNHGANNATRQVMGQYQVDTPGYFGPSTKVESHVAFDNGDSVHRVQSVQPAQGGTVAAPVKASTDAGEFIGWNYREDITELPTPATTSADGVFVPAIGQYAKSTLSTNSKGLQVQAHVVLTSTNVLDPERVKPE